MGNRYGKMGEYKRVKDKIKNIIILHFFIWIYSITSVLLKLASKYFIWSKEYIIYYIAIIGVLGIYALGWQQIIKKFDPSVAYSNKSITIVWTILYARIFFHENFTFQKVIGALMILMGIVITSRERK